MQDQRKGKLTMARFVEMITLQHRHRIDSAVVRDLRGLGKKERKQENLKWDVSYSPTFEIFNGECDDQFNVLGRTPNLALAIKTYAYIEPQPGGS